MAKEKIFAVFGLGSFGRKVCEVLSEKGGKVIAIDNQPHNIEKIKDEVTQAILLDSTDEEAMGAIPFADIDVAIVAIGDDLEANIISTAILKKMGIPLIIARALSEIHRQVLKQIGADEIINIEIDEGQRLALRLISPEVLDRIPLSESISIAELYPPKTFVGKTLSKLDLRNKLQINVMAIRRVELSVDEMGNPHKTENLLFPSSQEELQESDILILLGKNSDIENLKQY